jgi:hypothetical protein
MRIMNKLAVIALVLFASVSFADQPSRESATQSLYVLRAYGTYSYPNTASGIFRYDPATKTYTPFVPFPNGAGYRVPGSVHLGATADRVIAQGWQFYEFDLTTGRLLRRYESSDAAIKTWSFHGVVVTEEQARTLGIAAGTYGFPFCPYFQTCDPCSGSDTCPALQFLGYLAPTVFPYSVLLRRSLDPADPTLTAAKVIAPESTIYPTTVNVPHAASALDMTHRQFLTWAPVGTAMERQWATLPVIGGTIGDPTPVSVGTPSGIDDVLGLTFSETAQSLFDVVADRFYRIQFLKQAANNLTTSSVLEAVDSSSLHTDATTAIPVTLPDRYVQMIPAVGELHGLNGTFWRSDLWLYNPADSDVDVTIRRVTKPEQLSVQHLAAHGSVAMRNVLNMMGGGSAGDGVTLDALVIDAPYHWGAQLSAYSRTFTEASDGGTYGQAIPAVPTTTGYSTHPQLDYYSPDYTSSLFVIDQRQPGRFRHNLGVVNDGAKSLEMRLAYSYLQTGKSVSVAPHSVALINIESLFAGNVPSSINISASRAAPVWMSVVDNISQDATFVPFELFPLASDSSTEMAIPAVAATAGANGTSWRTDLFGVLPTVDDGTKIVTAMHFDAAAGCKENRGLIANTYIFSDVVRQFGPCGIGLGALRVSGSTWMAAYSRTYTTRPDGGTFGDMLPFYPSGGWPLQHFSGIEIGARFRINVGLYNGQSTTTTNRLLLYDANGALVAQRDIDLASHASLQAPLASLMNVASLPAGIYGLSVIPPGDGRSWAYVSLVDNISGDPTNLW